jgi:hypothetical protein
MYAVSLNVQITCHVRIVCRKACMASETASFKVAVPMTTGMTSAPSSGLSQVAQRLHVSAYRTHAAAFDKRTMIRLPSEMMIISWTTYDMLIQLEYTNYK